ncbi:MAG: ABC transporter substrate-binding protein [Alphaproteobacteria bacterium]
MSSKILGAWKTIAGFAFVLPFISSVSAAQDSRAIVRISVPGLGSMYTMPFQIAQEQGFYREEGLDVRILGGVRTAPSVQMLVGGSVEVTQTVGTTTLAAILQGAPLKVVMVFNDKPSYALYAKKSIRTFAELKGAKVASITPGSTGDRLLKIVLEKNGLQWKKDLQIIYIGTSDVLIKSLLSDSVDAAVLSFPGNLIAKDAGFVELASFAGEAGALTGGVATGEPFYSKSRDVLTRFLRATLKGLKFLKSNREGSAKIMTKFMGIPLETALRTYDVSTPVFTSDGILSEGFQDKVLDFELKAIGSDKRISRDKVFDFSILKSLR